MKWIVVQCHLDNSNNDDSIVYKIGFVSDATSKYSMVRLLCPTFFLGVEAPYGPEVINEFKSRQEAEDMIGLIGGVLKGIEENVL